MNKKVLITVAAVLVVGVTAFAATNTGLFTGNLLGLSKSVDERPSGNCVDFASLDLKNLEISDDFAVSSGVVSEVTSGVNSSVPSIVTSQVTTEITTDVPSIVTSEVPSSVTSEVTSTVSANVKCFTLKEKVLFYKEITKDLKNDIDDLVKKYKHFNTEYQKAVQELNATPKQSNTVKPGAKQNATTGSNSQNLQQTTKPTLNLKSTSTNATAQ